ncbi:MAG: hypothetical protein ACRDDZ_12650 [Marinifilaceae bacterium]
MKKIIALLIIFIGIHLEGNAQSYKEVVYLKNGSIINGIVIEQIPNESLKIQTADGSIYVYKMSEVVKITKEATTKKHNGFSSNNIADKTYNIAKGYKGFVDLGYAIGVGDWGLDRVEFSTAHGYQFNPYLFAGAGFGVNYYTDVELCNIPIFANIRANLLNDKITPFVDVKLGYSVVDIEGFYFAPSIGCRFGLTRRMAINLGVGYTMQKAEIFYTYGNYYYNDMINSGAIDFKVGFEF